MDEKKEVVKKVKIRTVIEAFLAIGFVFLVALAMTAYFYAPEKSSFLGRVLNMFSYPIVMIDGGNMIYTSDVRESVNVLKRFYESDNISDSGSRVDFTTDDGKKRLKIKEKEVLNREIENKALEVLAKKNGIVFSDKEIDNYYNWKISGEGILGQDFNDFVTRYGWGEDKIKEKIIIPMMRAEKLKEKMSAEISKGDESREKIESAKKELGDGKDFSEVALKYSEGQSKENGGDLGWIAKDQMVPEVSKRVFSEAFQKDKGYEIIESSLGYHIISIGEMKKENGMDMVKMNQIFVRKKIFGEWLNGEIKKMDIKILDKAYFWDRERGVADFSDQSMRDFEERTYEELKGDASVSKQPKL